MEPQPADIACGSTLLNGETHFKVVVVGLGGLGSSTLYWASKIIGSEVLGVEKFTLGHHNGGSQDQSRIIRLSYDEAHYVALGPEMYKAWQAVEEESDQQLIYRCGGVIFGPKKSRCIQSYISCMSEAGIEFEVLSCHDAGKRFPQFHLKESDIMLYQKDGGLVDAARANATHIALARRRGANILQNAPVKKISCSSDGKGGSLELQDGRTFTFDKVIICAGSWTNEMLAHFKLEVPLRVTQEQVQFFSTLQLKEFGMKQFPTWIYHGDEESSNERNNKWNTTFYGFPIYGDRLATKAGEDIGGDEVDPNTRNFQPNLRAQDRLVSFLQDYIPESLGPIEYTKTCLYDLTADRDFVVDTLPDFPQVGLLMGAAHAFKAASLLGRIISELVINGSTNYPIDRFKLTRATLSVKKL
eukprot:TRINITY_DN5715_c0_g1_i1.p1 TRINITY_DN5715_c0_g1~~TRINITY_DN5715_c0_g1_i1.p1  ORF type:complete len:414 (-),score=67.86 TRINITY_DN5715_c0_g1_i1:39-1280(-)